MTTAEATAVASTKTCVTAEAASVAAASAMLRPHGYGQEKRERGDSQQATHRLSIRPMTERICQILYRFRLSV